MKYYSAYAFVRGEEVIKTGVFEVTKEQAVLDKLPSDAKMQIIISNVYQSRAYRFLKDFNSEDEQIYVKKMKPVNVRRMKAIFYETDEE